MGTEHSISKSLEVLARVVGEGGGEMVKTEPRCKLQGLRHFSATHMSHSVGPRGEPPVFLTISSTFSCYYGKQGSNMWCVKLAREGPSILSNLGPF